MPETGLVLAVRCRGSARMHVGGTTQPLPTATLTGLRHSVRVMHTAAGGCTAIALFRPSGAAACFALQLQLLFGTFVPLENVLLPPPPCTR